jgi:hypothetical protein
MKTGQASGCVTTFEVDSQRCEVEHCSEGDGLSLEFREATLKVM